MHHYASDNLLNKVDKVFVIGSGNVAYHLCNAMQKAGIAIRGIHSRNRKTLNSIAKKYKVEGFTSLSTLPLDCDIYLLCVQDDNIKDLAESLPDQIVKNKIIAHTSGTKSMAQSLKKCAHPGIFYPLQTFSKHKRMRYSDIPFCIYGGNEQTISTLQNLAKKISNNVNIINDEQRAQIHLSAVAINNFVNHIIYLAESHIENKEIDASILKPLLRETIKKQAKIGSYHAQTGPAIRGDVDTIKKHLDFLEGDEAFRSIYKAITDSITKTYKIS